ncbi:MAG TPA: septal ring lytic transglycosylase RlpA family protein [Stellaceae bacterium]|nr:septal ring lytic transglycosylase RlpA family protein [Stellaceae bacterium]
MIRNLPLATLLLAITLIAGCASEPKPAAPVQTAAAPATVSPAVTAPGNYKIGRPYKVDGVWYYPAEDWSYDETGIASWYGRDFNGKRTSSGEVFDSNALTAAHRTLPLPSIVEITNLANGRVVHVRVNDRGPFARGRVIDVSRRTAQLLGFEGSGTAKVRVRILADETRQAAGLAPGSSTPVATASAAPREVVDSEALPPPRPTPHMPETVAVVPVKKTHIYVQAGAFAYAQNALQLQKKLAPVGHAKLTSAHVNGTDVFRVRFGPMPSVAAADTLLDKVAARGYRDAKIVVD